MSETTQPLAELLLRAWQLKVGGEAFFTGVARKFPDRRAELKLIAAVERSACALIEPVARSHGLELDVLAVTAGVHSYVEGLGPDLEAILHQSAELGRGCTDLYRQLGEAGTAEHRELAVELATVEEAAVDFMDAMVHGTSDNRRSALEAIAATRRFGQ